MNHPKYPSLHKLLKFFKLEAERGYDNHAVLGGLERMLERWEAEARIDNLPNDIVQAVVSRIRNYAQLSTTSRAETLEGLRRRIKRFEEGLPSRSPETDTDLEKKGETTQPLDTAKGEPELVELPPTPPIARPLESDHSDQEDELSEFAEPMKSEGRPVPAPQARRSGPQAASPPWNSEPAAMEASITVLTGIGPRHAQTLSRLGLITLRDMLYHFPRRYDDYSQLKPINRLIYGEEITVIGTVQSSNLRPIRGGKAQLFEAVIGDGSGVLRVTWFNQPWLAKRLYSGTQIVLSGKVDQYLGRPVMENPEWEPLEQQQLSTNRIVPVYPLTAQITQRWMRQQMNQVVTYWAPRIQDPLPVSLRQSAGLLDLPRALLQIHFPDSWEDLHAAQQRLAFDDIFLLQLGVQRQRRAWQERTAHIFTADPEWLQNQLGRLPFPLTGAQQHALEDVYHDLALGRPMNRLLQGDVGSGKTVIAALACNLVCHQNAQAALMAPTSILAEQHYKNFVELLAQKKYTDVASVTDQNSEDEAIGLKSGLEPPLHPEEIRLMIGATPETVKREIRAGLADGTIKLVIGTHALIEDPVQFSNLQLIIVDEQHRFGVQQRAMLRAKGGNPHLLVMTATPIPRSLALTVYGDLDLSIMDEMPPGRLPVSTHVLPPRERERAYKLIQHQVEQGRQAFIIYPLIEEGEHSSEEETGEAKAAVAAHARLQQEIFPHLRLGLLHGRLRPDDKESVMTQFRDGQFDILISTTVVEVGVDVPNATVMLIEGANRFGLAQLHQLRGRVGRGAEKAYCLLIPDTVDALENERLKVMEETNDGFVLAERDLVQRGPGQFLGTRQSGLSEIQLANLTDVRLIEKARKHALALFEQDPLFERPENRPLLTAVRRFWSIGKGDIS